MKKLVCYTCCTGGYDNISQYEVINPNWDYVYFTDNEELIKQKQIGHWEIRPLAFSKLTNVKNARWHKVNAHILFPEYEYSLWLDANITIKSENVINKIKQLIKEDTLFSVPLHPNRNCIYDEAKVIIDLDIDYSKIVKSEIKFLKKEKYPTTNGLHETCILFRKHNQLKNTLDLWWKMIKSYSKRDQLSFDYAIWKNNISVLPLYEKGTEHRTNGDFVFRYGNNHNQDKIKCKNFTIFKKTKKPNGRRQIYFCGIKIFSYKKNIKFTDKKTLSPIEHIRSLGVKVGKNFRPIIHPHPWSYPDFGSEPFLIEIGNDVCISFGCTFLTHDASVHVCEKLSSNPDDKIFKYGRIKIGNNVFIGCKSIILPNVTIGNNSIVGAGSVVTKSIPDNEVWAGNPARFISKIEDFSKKSYALYNTIEQKNLRDFVNKMRKK